MSHSRIVPASTQSDSDLNAVQADILRASLIPPSTHYLQQLLPSVPAPKSLPPDIESIPPARIDTHLARCISARETVGEAREIDRREVEFVPVELAKAFVRRVEEEAKSLDRQYRATLKDMDRTYEQLEAETQTIYHRFIEKIHRESRAQVQYYQDLAEKYIQEFREYKVNSERTLRLLQEKIHSGHTEKKELAQNALTDLTRIREENRQEIEALREANQAETAKRLVEQGNAYKERVETLEKDLDETQALVKSLKSDAETQLKGAENTKAAETAFLRQQLQTLQTQYESERGQWSQQELALIRCPCIDPVGMTYLLCWWKTCCSSSNFSIPTPGQKSLSAP